jgi:Predicted integral membrane protein
MDFVPFFNKWLHLLSIIGMLGGTAMAWLVLHPALKERADDPDAQAIWRRYGMLQGILWVIVLITGFYNYYIVTPTVTGSYHMFLGMKIMLAILMFVLAMLAAHPAPGLEKLTRNKGPWLAVILVMGIAAVGISAHLNMGRVSGKFKKPATANVQEGSQELVPGAR